MPEHNKSEFSEIQLIRKEVQNLKFSIEMLNDRVGQLHEIQTLQNEKLLLKIELQLSLMENKLLSPTN